MKKKTVLFVCGGNTCRSPMAKAILEKKLNGIGRLGDFTIDSTAFSYTTLQGASVKAREAIKILLGEDLLLSHKPKRLSRDLAGEADLILAMETRMIRGLPENKTWTLKEYAGETGDVEDPFGGNIEDYLKCAQEISGLLESILPKLSQIPVLADDDLD